MIYGFTHSRTVTSNTDFPRKPPGIKVHHQSTLGAKYGQQIILLSLFILRGKIPILWLQWSHWFLCVCVKSMHSRLLSHFSIFYAFLCPEIKTKGCLQKETSLSLSACWISMLLHHGLNSSCRHLEDSRHKGSIIESKVRKLLILGLATKLQ